MLNHRWTAKDMPSQQGKTFLVTGANSGIGLQAAMDFANHGGHVILGCRNEGKGRSALDQLLQGRSTGSAELALLDMASLGSIRKFAEKFVASGRPLDVLVNNAGVMALPERQITADGFEKQFGTNHLGHFALTGLLLPALQRSSAARVVTVASLAHRNGRMKWDDLQAERNYVPWDSYNDSKLANILFARELERRAKAAHLPLQSNPVHPGVARTKIFENGPGFSDLKGKIVRLLGPFLSQGEDMGALPIELAATSLEIAGGDYIGPGGFGELKGFPRVVQPRPHALDAAQGARLWKVSEELTGISYL